MKETNNITAPHCTINNNGNHEGMAELESIRHEMQDLRSLIAGQQIVSERILRRAMDTDLSQERKDIRFSILMGVTGSVIAISLFPIIGIPWWFNLLTVAFMTIAILASLYTLRKHMHINMAADNLLTVAGKIIAYKKFGYNWLKFSIPFLIVWLALFFHTLSQHLQGEELQGILCGGIVGLVIGLVCGVMYLYKSHKRLNGILRQIEEMRGE